MQTFLNQLTQENRRRMDEFIRQDVRWANGDQRKQWKVATKWGLDRDHTNGIDDGEGPVARHDDQGEDLKEKVDLDSIY